MQKQILYFGLLALMSSIGFNPPVISPAFAQNPPPPQTVVMTRDDIKAGRVLTANMLEEKQLEPRFAPVNAVSGIAECSGRSLKRNKKRGQIILIDDLDNP